MFLRTNLEDIRPGLDASQEDDGLFGLVDLLDLVRDHQGQLRYFLDDVTCVERKIFSFLMENSGLHLVVVSMTKCRVLMRVGILISNWLPQLRF